MTDTKFEVYGVNEEVDLRDLDCVEIPEPDIDRFKIPDEDVVFATLNLPYRSALVAEVDPYCV